MTRARLVRRLWLALAAVALLVIGCAGFHTYLKLSGNLHTIVAGQAYRSGQLDGPRLAEAIDGLGLRSILNLRGPQPGKDWYRIEREVAAAHNVAMIDFSMSDAERIEPGRMAELIALMRAAPKPMLIHCRIGADRTGLAAALYEAAISGTPPALAGQQLSLRFGHVGLPYLSRTWPMDQSWRDYLAAALEAPGRRERSAGALALVPAGLAADVTPPSGD